MTAPAKISVMTTIPLIEEREVIGWTEGRMYRPNIKRETMENRMVEEAYRQELMRRLANAPTQQEQIVVVEELLKEKASVKRKLTKERAEVKANQ